MGNVFWTLASKQRRKIIIEVLQNYSVYLHTNLSNQKKYVGITHLEPKVRWSNGTGYIQNRKFYNDIQLYGWDGFSHKIIKDSLTYLEARELETQLIKEYDSVNQGYNNVYSSTTDRIKFNFYDFAILDNKCGKYKNETNYFTRVPNNFIRNNLSKKFGLNRIFLLVYIFIDRNRTYEDMSYISVGEILKSCGYKLAKTKPKIFFEVIKSLLFLKENYFIEVDFDIYTLSYNDLIPIKIITQNFDATNSFTKIYGKDLDVILSKETTLNRESIIVTFLYINSYIGCRSKKDDGSEFENAKDNPKAFWRSIESMAKELSMSKDTISQCIDCLTTSSENYSALLIKREVGSVQPDKAKPPKNVPNIYVLNKEGYKQEIEWALNKMLEIYGVDEFYPSKSGNYRFEWLWNEVKTNLIWRITYWNTS